MRMMRSSSLLITLSALILLILCSAINTASHASQHQLRNSDNDESSSPSPLPLLPFVRRLLDADAADAVAAAEPTPVVEATSVAAVPASTPPTTPSASAAATTTPKSTKKQLKAPVSRRKATPGATAVVPASSPPEVVAAPQAPSQASTTTAAPSNTDAGELPNDIIEQQQMTPPSATPTNLLGVADTFGSFNIGKIQGIVDALNSKGIKADDKESERAFTTVKAAPKGGLRVVKDMLTGRLKALQKPTGDDAKNVSAVVAASLAKAGDKEDDDPAHAIRVHRGALPASSALNRRDRNNKGRKDRNNKNRPTPPRMPPAHRHSHAAKQLGEKTRDNTKKTKDTPRDRADRNKPEYPLFLSLSTDPIRTTILTRSSTLAPEWNISESSSVVDINKSLVPATTDYTDFFLWRSILPSSTSSLPLTPIEQAARRITCQKPFIMVNNSEVANVKLVSWNQKTMTAIPVLSEDVEKRTEEYLASSQDNPTESDSLQKQLKAIKLLFTLQYECLREGPVLITAVQRYYEMKKAKRYTETWSWSWVKMCGKQGETTNDPASATEGLIAPGEGVDATKPLIIVNTDGNTALPGLSIGTRRNWTDIIEHGEAKANWTLGSGSNGNDDPAVSSPPSNPFLHTYSPEEEGSKYWLRYDDTASSSASLNLTVNRVLILIDNPLVLHVDESGDLTEQSTVLRGGRTYTLSLTYTCKTAGSSLVTVVFSFPSIESGKVTFSFMKECSGLSVGDGVTKNGVDIYFGQDTAVLAREPEVVKNGVVQPEWRPIQDLATEQAMNRTAIADETERYAVFFVKLRKDHHPIEYDTPIVESYSLDGELLLRPVITGSILESNKLVFKVPRYIIITFNCLRAGDGVVTIKLPLRPSGAIQFNMRKSCALETQSDVNDAKEAETKEYSTGAVLTPLPGINVGHSIDTSSVVLNGITRPRYHLTDTSNELMFLGKKYAYINFFLSKNTSEPNAKDMRFGRPELIATNEIAKPIISGLGAEGGLVSDDEYSVISITFHCFTAGNMTLSLVIPLVSDEWITPSGNPVSIAPARPDPIRISFKKECPESQDEPVIGLGGIGISGFSVGKSDNTSELVYNGFPQPKYFGQRGKIRPDWDDDVIIPETVDSNTIYFHFNSHDSLKPNKLVGKEVIFQAPVIVGHSPIARPTLAGTAAAGGVLVRDQEAIPLDITYGCKYAGLAVVTLLIPIIPHGQISVDIPKRCSGAESPHGQRISGLHVGTSEDASDVIQDGITHPRFVSYATRKYSEAKILPEEETTTFWIRSEGEPIRAIEPLIFVAKPIVNVRISHALLLNSTQVDDDVDGDEIEINSESSAINITYACVSAGATDITVTLNLLPKGQLQWTFEKRCYGDDVVVDELLAHHPIGIAGIKPSEDDTPSPFDVPNAGPAGWHPPLANAPGSSDRPQPAEASIQSADDLDDSAYNPPSYNPHSSIDSSELSRTSVADVSSSQISRIQIGTGRTSLTRSDVFSHSLPQPRYKMNHAKTLDVAQVAVVKPDQDTSSFYISSTSEKIALTFGEPVVRIAPQYASHLKPHISGTAAVGGTIVGTTQSQRFDVAYECKIEGVYAVAFQVPVGDRLAIFRVIKICARPDSADRTDRFYFWTAGRVMFVIFLLAGIVAVALGWKWIKKFLEQKKIMGSSTTQYAPVQQQAELEEL